MTGVSLPRPPAIPSDRTDASVQPQGQPSTGLTQASIPTGLFMTQDHRYFMNGKGPLPSVTSILRVLDKPALTAWYKRQVAESAVLGYDHWKDLAAEDAVKWLTSMPNAQRDRAAERGTEIHGLVDAAGRSPDGGSGLPVSQEYADTLSAFAGFLEACGGSQSIVSSEKAVLNLSEGYAGTFDLLMHKDNELWLIDVKTGKGVYPDYALQLAGYGMAEHIALPNDPTLYPFPEPQRYGVLHLRPERYSEAASTPEGRQYPDGYRLLEYSITDRERLAFLAALELWRWMQAHKQ